MNHAFYIFNYFFYKLGIQNLKKKNIFWNKNYIKNIIIKNIYKIIFIIFHYYCIYILILVPLYKKKSIWNIPPIPIQKKYYIIF